MKTNQEVNDCLFQTIVPENQSRKQSTNRIAQHEILSKIKIQ